MSYFDDVIEPKILNGSYYIKQRSAKVAYELRELSGSVFKNRNKQHGDNKPEFTGEAKIDGKVYWVSAWKKTDKNGSPWFSFSFKEKDFTEAKKAVEETPVRESRPAPYDFDDGDSIPF